MSSTAARPHKCVSAYTPDPLLGDISGHHLCKYVVFHTKKMMSVSNVSMLILALTQCCKRDRIPQNKGRNSNAGLWVEPQRNLLIFCLCESLQQRMDKGGAAVSSFFSFSLRLAAPGCLVINENVPDWEDDVVLLTVSLHLMQHF